jgi:hypothetical protein
MKVCRILVGLGHSQEFKLANIIDFSLLFPRECCPNDLTDPCQP